MRALDEGFSENDARLSGKTIVAFDEGVDLVTEVNIIWKSQFTASRYHKRLVELERDGSVDNLVVFEVDWRMLKFH